MINEKSLINLEKRGRKKGDINKFTRIKYEMLSCFKLGEFKKWAKDNYSDYVKCMCSVMPKDFNVDMINAISIDEEVLNILEKKLQDNDKKP